jgi:L-cystine uptake protein TcyP (sodium:dicarboxylate symporter family)
VSSPFWRLQRLVLESGAGVGIGLSYWEPTNPDAKQVAIKWVGLIGDLFLRTLKCAVLPVSYRF